MEHLDRHASLGLYAFDEVASMDKRFSDDLGPHSRRYGYHHLLDDSKLLREFFWSLGNRRQALGALALRPVYARLMRKALRINAKTAARSKERILAVATDVEARLSDGRPYLCGDVFSAADLSYAALMAPSLLLTKGEGYGSEFPSMERAGGEVAAFARQMRDRRAGAFALEMYREHRGRSCAV